MCSLSRPKNDCLQASKESILTKSPIITRVILFQELARETFRLFMMGLGNFAAGNFAEKNFCRALISLTSTLALSLKTHYVSRYFNYTKKLNDIE